MALNEVRRIDISMKYRTNVILKLVDGRTDDLLQQFMSTRISHRTSILSERPAVYDVFKIYFASQVLVCQSL